MDGSMDQLLWDEVNHYCATGVGILVTVWRYRDQIIYVVENTSKAWKLEWQTSFPFETMEDGESSEQTASRWIKEELGIDILPEAFSSIWAFDLIVAQRDVEKKIKVIMVSAHIDDLHFSSTTSDEIQKSWVMSIKSLSSLASNAKRPCVDEWLKLLEGWKVGNVHINDLRV